MVEGDAENNLVPVIAEILGFPLEKHGISIVNVGSTAFLRYSHIMVRADGSTIGIPVSVVTDCDVKLYDVDPVTRVKTFNEKRTASREAETEKNQKYTNGSVCGFCSPYWTLEYCLAILFPELEKLVPTLHIAMMFVMCFYKMLRQKSFIRCGIYAILAVIFHYSAIFALVIIGVLTIVKLKPSKMLFFISITVGIILALFLPQIINLIIRFVPSASGYATYVNWRRNSQIRLVLGVAGTSLIYIYLLYLIVKNRMQIKQLNETRYLEISFLIIGLCINLASIRIWVVQRIALYFYQFIILIIPALLKTFEPTKRRRVKRVLYFIMFIYLIFSGIFIGENEYYSYNTIFSGDRPMYDADFNRMFQ